MTRLSIVIPVYKYDRNLDLCLLSILGQVSFTPLDVLCVPIGSCCLEFGEWIKNDNRVTALQNQKDLNDALSAGVCSAQGRYVLFMNQTDTISSVSNLIEALNQAEQSEVQALLAACQQRLDANAFSAKDLFAPRTDLLPSADLQQPFSPEQAGVALLIIGLPTIFGNIYEREMLLSLLLQSQSFSNASDLVISQVALMKAKSISFTTTAITECRYEDCFHPLLTAEELKSAEEAIALMIMITLSPEKAARVARNVIIFYLTHLISLVHPFKRFQEVVLHYKELCQKLSNPAESDVTFAMYGCWQYLSLIATADEAALIEIYSLPQRGMVFSNYTTRQNS